MTRLIFGAVPALQSSRADVQDILRSETRGTTSGRSTHLIRGSLVGAEVAVALTPLLGAGLLIKVFGLAFRRESGLRRQQPAHLQHFVAAREIRQGHRARRILGSGH